LILGLCELKGLPAKYRCSGAVARPLPKPLRCAHQDDLAEVVDARAISPACSGAGEPPCEGECSWCCGGRSRMRQSRMSMAPGEIRIAAEDRSSSACVLAFHNHIALYPISPARAQAGLTLP